MGKNVTNTRSFLPDSRTEHPLSRVSDSLKENFTTKKNNHQKVSEFESRIFAGLFFVLGIVIPCIANDSFFSFEARLYHGKGSVPVMNSLSGAFAAAERMAIYDAVKQGAQRIALLTESNTGTNGDDYYNETISLSLTASIAAVKDVSYSVNKLGYVHVEADVYTQLLSGEEAASKRMAAENVLALLNKPFANEFARMTNLCSALEMISRENLPDTFYRYGSLDTVSVTSLKKSIETIISHMSIVKVRSDGGEDSFCGDVLIDGILSGQTSLKKIVLKNSDGTNRTEERADLGLLGLQLARYGFTVPHVAERV